ncbi:ATP-binding protein [Chryseosolibacter indicus]|uniref:ATP-binding protein n=1 Tax=Chryseosolibacter indicus TaxID=2782351 RepID=A0ABS5VY62_9BACT|nr:ATP-binding protein [Chryseosolibacter indicus]MBT1705869.1 ATP-binding protein [Chryseosolibacter indicus]
MKVNISNAVKLFFPNPSLEMVYFEAIANAVDANATSIEVFISIDAYNKPESLTIAIKDNGDGFNAKNFEKFSKLLEIEAEDHKGIGRLVFLNYFKEVAVTSIFEGQKRSFLFTGAFDGEHEITNVQTQSNETELKFKGYRKDKVKSYDYLKPESIKNGILLHFFPLFYSLKMKGSSLKIGITLTTLESNAEHNFYSERKELIVSEIPNLQEESFPADGLDLFEKLKLFYSIKENPENQTLITAISVDNRTIPVEIFSRDAIPAGYEIIFLLYSDLFKGKANSSRQELEMEESDVRTLKRLFGEQVSKILNDKIPKIQERNRQVTESLKERFPHLSGYFEEESVGLIDRNQSLELAQRKFFNAQKEILDSQSLSEDQYQKSLEISARILTEYILYRNIIINKLKQIDPSNDEADIHNIIVPRRKTFVKSDSSTDLYTNNAWLLDDKYMSYTTILSEREMGELIQNISLEEHSERIEKRPDIAIIFSNDPERTAKVDVVIVELKKLGLGLAKREEVISQLKQRARKLLRLYPTKIQRIWFYGVVDFNDEFKISLLEEKFIELFSSGTVFYKEHSIILDLDQKTEIPVGLYVMSYEAFLKDAETRNHTFLNLLKESLKQDR